MAIQTFELQPNFPNEDLTSANADFVKLYLMDLRLLNEQHTSAEERSKLYAVTHRLLSANMREVFESKDQAIAYSLGVAAFESCAHIASGAVKRVGHSDTFILDYIELAITDFGNPIKHLQEAQERFIDQMPRTKSIIVESAERFLPGQVEYAIGGAAMAYVTEIDTVNDMARRQFERDNLA